MSRYAWILRDGVIAVVVTALTGLLVFHSIAEDVAVRAGAALKAGGRDWAVVSTDGRDVTLSGVAPAPEERQLAVSDTDVVWGVRVVADETTVLPLASPFPVGAERNAKGVTLTGAVPSEKARAALVARAAALLPGVAVSDRAVAARGAPADWLARAEFVFRRLAGLKTGFATFAGDDLSIGGEPVDWPTWRAIEDELASGLPAGTRVVADTLTVPVPDPYRLTLSAKAGAAIVSGFVPDADVHDKILDMLKSRFASVDDRLMRAPGAPSGFVDTVLALIPDLARFGDLDFELSGSTAKLQGTAVTAALGQRIVDRIRALLPAGFALGGAEVAALPPPPQVAPAECQTALAAVQNGDKILFDTGLATLSADSTRVLDRLVATSLKCLEAKITVEGHTDAQGDPAANQALSEARAAAVVDYLVAGGIAADRLTAVGWGATRPVADNDTDEGRQQNRRIEFHVE